MARFRVLALAVVVVFLLGAVGCKTGTTGGSGGNAEPGESSEVPAVFDADEKNAAELAITSDGGGAFVAGNGGRAAVSVPAGAVPDGTSWRLIPIATAPAGVEKPLAGGIYVDTAGREPSQPCSVGFMIPSIAPANATITRVADDGTTEVIATSRSERNGATYLTAYVEGFSAYFPTEADEEAITKAWSQGKIVDWTIKVAGTETQQVEGWTFNYEVDFFASGGDIGMGGTYAGHGDLWVTGTYDQPMGIIATMGDLSGHARDDNLKFTLIEHSLASLLTGESEDTVVNGWGTMNGKGLGELNIAAWGPNVAGGTSESAEGATPLPFTLIVNGEDVQLEIPNVGIFPGKILRTTN